jgi:hypothetical protein
VGTLAGDAQAVKPLEIDTEVTMRAVVLILAARLFLVTGPQVAGETAGAADDVARFRREYADVLALEGTSKSEILAIARILRANPEMAIDRTAEGGEYCFKSSVGSMVHFAVHPERTAEGVVYELDASGLIAAGLDPARLKPLPALGEMTPGVWYFLPKGQLDPHHGHAMNNPTIAMAVSVK